MNKKEKKQLEDALTLASMHPTPRVDADVMPPSLLSDGVSVGYIVLGCNPPKVEPACSSSIYHGTGQQTRVTTQGSRKLFSTEILAWRAARNIIEVESMDKLRRIDRIIEQLELKS